MFYNKTQLTSVLPELIEQKNIVEIRQIFEEYNIVDLADILSLFSLENTVFIFRILPRNISAELFSYLDNDLQSKLIETFGSKEIGHMIDNMFSDDIVEFLEEMPANIIKKILASIPEENRQEINLMLSYKDNTAGSIMSTDFMELHSHITVSEAIKKIKQQAQRVETINSCYIIDQSRNYLGVVELRDIIISKNEVQLQSLVKEPEVYVYTDTDQEEVAKILSEYDATSIPVLNGEQRLIGIVTADDVLDVLVEEATEDIHKMSGVTSVEGSYLKTSIKEIVQSRIYWLLILMISASFTGTILQIFEDKLNAVAILAASIPVIMSTAGNAGSQSSTTIIRGIVVENLSLKEHFFTVVKKEFLISLYCGLIVFAVNMVRLLVMQGSDQFLVAVVVSLTLVVSIFVSNIIGGLLPLIAKACKTDPAAMAAPLITTIVDALSLIVYFLLAIEILHI